MCMRTKIKIAYFPQRVKDMNHFTKKEIRETKAFRLSVSLHYSVLSKLLLIQQPSVYKVHYHSDNKASKTLARLGKAIMRNALLLTGTVGATEPPVVVAGDPPVGNVLFQLGDEDSAPVVAATGILSVVLHCISYKIAL